MEILHAIRILERFAQATGKPCMYVGFDPDDGWKEIVKAAPYLKENYQALCDGQAWLIFDSNEERDQHYKMTVGKDGPTELNKYDGPARVYAITAGETMLAGKVYRGTLNENT